VVSAYLKKYESYHKKLKWVCAKGHKWEAKLANIRAGTWCPECGKGAGAKSRKLTIEQMQELAMLKGGECLSKTYVNANTKLKWKCEYGHTWETTLGKIKSGTWCPKCYQNRRKR
jgi:hypothetical protein